MRITGQFRDIHENLYSVEIDNPSVSHADIIIGEHYNDGDNDILYFTDEPCKIETESDDLFTVIIKKSATINLYARDYIGDLLYAGNARSVTVLIKKDTTVLFDGFVEPGTYNQPYSEPYDEFTINCIDKLSTLQYYKYKGITVDNFDSKLAELGSVTIRDVIDLALKDVIGKGELLYDCTKGITKDRRNKVFDEVIISEQIMVGDDFDSVMTYDDILTEILKYLNLHIRQNGSSFYIFDLKSIIHGNSRWLNLINNQYHTSYNYIIPIGEHNNAGPDTNITVDEVYNQISLTCELNDQDVLIESPLDEESLTSVFKNRQLYMQELISEGNGSRALSAFKQMALGYQANYDGAKKVNWYLQWLQPKNWKLYTADGEVSTLYEKDTNGVYMNQYKISERLKGHPIEPAILSMGNVEYPHGVIKDDAPITKINMSNYLYISLNGNQSRNENKYQPNSSVLQRRQPIAEYIGSNSGGVFSPSDDETTNYLVFSGKLCFLPVQKETASWPVVEQLATGDTTGWLTLYDKTVPSDNNKDGRYYTRKFFRLQYPNSDETTAQVTSVGISPLTQDKSSHLIPFNYSEDWEWGDKRSNLEVLECELIIGNKRLIERPIEGTDKSTFEWVKIGEEPTATYQNDTYKITTFSIGVNPKIGDYIIGDEFPIRANFDFKANIDADGLCVPIKKSDGVSGKVIFRILGPINTTWDDVARRHPTWFRHTQWTSTKYYVLSQADALIIKDFKVSLKTDAAGYNTDFQNNDKDLVYMSNETDAYVNKKDDINFKIITQPSTEECIRLGCSLSNNYNAAIDAMTGLPIRTIYDAFTDETAKPEEHYVNQYYQLYSKPKIMLETELWVTYDMNLRTTYSYSSLNRNFFPIGETRDLVNDKVMLKLREI